MKLSTPTLRGPIASRGPLAFVCFALLFGLAGPAQASITVDYGYFQAYASDGLGGYDSFNAAIDTTIDPPLSIPVNAVVGNSWSKNTVDFSTDGPQTTLLLTMDHQRTGSLYSHAYSYAYLVFTANHDEAFELSGCYNVTDKDDGSGEIGSSRVYQEAYLQDTFTGGYLFSDYSVSMNMSNEKFILGAENDGDYGNSTLGDLKGDLIAGRQYLLYYHTYIYTYPDADNGASALGNLKLTIGTAVAPEASTIAVWSLLGLTATVLSRRAFPS